MFKVKVTAKVKNVSEYLSGWYFLNHKTFFAKLGSSRMSQSVNWNKTCLLSSRSQWGLIWSKYDSDYYTFWTANSLVTKLGLIRYHRPEHLVERLDYFILGQGHSEGSKCLCLSRWYLLNYKNILFPNLVLWCTIMELACHAKRICLLFSRSRLQHGLMWSKYDSFYNILWTAVPFGTKIICFGGI